MEGDDSNEESRDSDFNWLSALFDCGQALEMDIEYHKEQQGLVAEWLPGVVL